MGLDYSSKLLVGVPAEILYKKKITTRSRTKYNQDTGKPYQVKIKISKYLWLGKETEEDIEELVESIDLEYILGSYPTGEGGIIGLKLSGLDMYDEEIYTEVQLEQILEKLAEVNSKLEKVGITKKASIYLMNQCS